MDLVEPKDRLIHQTAVVPDSSFRMRRPNEYQDLSFGGRCRIRTCVGVSRRIYGPCPGAFVVSRPTRVGAGHELELANITLWCNVSRRRMATLRRLSVDFRGFAGNPRMTLA